MPPATSKRIFISYSHKDIRWHNELASGLKPYQRADSTIISWSDKEIHPGSKWFEEIKSARTAANVAVLLVTRNFLASDFIHEHELGPLLKEAEKGGVKLLWVPVRTCAWKKTALTNYQAVLDTDKPLADMTNAQRDRAWLKICDAIEAAMRSLSPEPVPEPSKQRSKCHSKSDSRNRCGIPRWSI
jgi:internalin A